MSTARLGSLFVGAPHPVRIMAVLNVSPESFYHGSVAADARAVTEAATVAQSEGADMLDVGAMSTAPYLRTEIPVGQEVERIVWAMRRIREVCSIPVSVDTTRAPVAAAALAEGACAVNDVSGLRGDAGMADIAAQAEGIVLVANENAGIGGEPLERVRGALGESLERARRAGIADERIVLDPGIGFFPKAPEPPEELNAILLARLDALVDLGRPLLVGASRKAFIGRLTRRSDPRDRLAGSLAAAVMAVSGGAAMIRTHDVAATRDAVRVAEAICRQRR